VQNGALTVIRILSLSEGKPFSTYHGQRLANPDFLPIRSATNAADSKGLYEDLRKTPKYQALPQAGTIDARREAMSTWEDANPAECSMSRDDGQFFGFKEVSLGYMGQFTRFIPIPAVRDASAEAEEGDQRLLNLLIW